MRSMAGLMLAFGLLTVGPAAAQSDLSALRGKARMPITMKIEGGSLGDALSMLAEAADIEIRVEPDWAASPPLTATFLNTHFGDALTFLLKHRQRSEERRVGKECRAGWARGRHRHTEQHADCRRA